MKLAEPIQLLINKKCVFKSFFKVENNTYLLFNGVQTCKIKEINEKDYITLTEEDTIPFIIVHNWRMNNTVNDFKLDCTKDNNNIISIVSNARIENEINTDITIDNILSVFKDKCLIEETLHLRLLQDIVEKYNNIKKE